MRFVVVTQPGVVEFNYMWAPTFIGMNSVMRKEIEKKVAPLLEGKPATDEVLDAAHDKIVELLCEKFQIPGLKDYLDAIKFIEDGP